jgi:hypothetical protein
MFGKEKISIENLSRINPTSKLSLKMSCIAIAEGDLEKAAKMYEFFVQDMELPDVDPVPPTKMQAIKNGVADFGGFIKDNKDDIMDFVNFVSGFFGKKPTSPTGGGNIPPLPN